MWDPGEVLAAASAGLAAREAEWRAEQAVRGLDSLSELDLHGVLEAGLCGCGWCVLREQPYPGPAGSRAFRRERERCDFALLPAGLTWLRDGPATLRERDARAGTLFERVPTEEPAGAADPEDAYWLEVKVVGQHAPRQGVPEPNAAYAAELVRAISEDLLKLAKEPRATHAGVLLVMFTEDEATAAHDLDVALHRALDRGAAFRGYRRTTFPVLDRIGNSCCTTALVERALA
ncbi:MAG: hypothetical protein DYG92_05555 [Leptolyngbya sp. PLA1]|nr:hypothetical protein [Leptolyngbya sp. PLA1]